MYSPYVTEEYEIFDDPGEQVDDIYEYTYPVRPHAPDVILIAGVTLVMGFLLIGFLSRLTGVFFDLEELPNQRAMDPAEQKEAASQDLQNLKTWSSDDRCAVSSRFPAKVTRWCTLITQYAQKHDLDPDLVAAVVWLESGGNELAYSHSGAVGLMQVMPRDGLAASFRCANGPCFKDRPSSDELRDPEFNIAYGTRFLSGLVRRTGNIRDALRSYGPMDAGYTYADKVLSIFNRYKDD